MKKHLVLSFLVAFALCGCKEEVNIITLEASRFTASIEDNYPGGLTRTSLDEHGNVLWKSGDQVSIFAGNTVNEQYQVTDDSDGKTSASLNKVTSSGFVAGTEISNNVAYYPYSSEIGIAKNGTGYTISGITLPATQTYAQASFANGAFPMAAITGSTEDNNLGFKNILGGLKLQLKGTAKIASISISGNADEILCGSANVTVSTTAVPEISLADASAKTVTLNCGTEGVQLNADTATPFIIALPPMTMASGFTVTVKDTDGKQMEIKTSKSQTITRSSLLKMPAVEYAGESSNIADGFEYVDLGLPSGIKWATCNMGAQTPEERGEYYQWAGSVNVTSSAKLYDCPYHTGSSETEKWTKYIPSAMSSYWSGKGDPDDILTLNEEDDAVHVNMGGKWRMPTAEDYEELTDNCSMAWTTNFNDTGMNGLVLTSKITGYTDKFIFLPAAGFLYGSLINSDNSEGKYWTSTLYSDVPSNARDFYFRSGWRSVSYGDRYYGYSIRPVYDENYHEHSIILVNGQDPAETVPGWKECYQCSTCGKYFEDENGLVPIGDGAAYDSWKSMGGRGYLELPHAVDLGLSVKWASCNIGAENPYADGNSYVWGETSPKSEYNGSGYKFGTKYKFSKYCTSIVDGKVDNKIILDEEDDAAYVNWGGNWRMPTSEEYYELCDESNCEWTKYDSDNTEFNGVVGWKVRSLKSGYTDNYIFIPADGQYYLTNSLCASQSDKSLTCRPSGGKNGTQYPTSRGTWCPIRPVYSPDAACGITGVTLDKTTLSLRVDDNATLTATVSMSSNAVNDIVEWSSSDPSIASVKYNGYVTAVGVGTAVITARTAFGGFTSSCEVTVSSAPSVHEYVDLGLSVKWATCNVGANNPYGYGKYYAWGETKAFGEEDESNATNYNYTSSYTRAHFDWEYYKYCNGSNTNITKYCTNSQYGTVDDKTVLDLEDDAARVNWGEGWRMPTYDEICELGNYNKCDQTWTVINGVRGLKIQSKIEGYTDNYIFIPAAGYCNRYGVNDKGTCVTLWSSTLYDYSWGAYRIEFFYPNGGDNTSYYMRCYGRTIRPVKE